MGNNIKFLTCGDVRLYIVVQQHRIGKIRPPPVIGKDEQVGAFDIITQDFPLRGTVKDGAFANQKICLLYTSDAADE